jgi:hypothetical protein
MSLVADSRGGSNLFPCRTAFEYFLFGQGGATAYARGFATILEA